MVASIMSNERTWGDLEARKTIVVDYKHGIVTRNRGQRDSAYVPGHHQGIVTPAIAKAAKLVAASSRSIAKGVFDLCVIQEGSLKGFIGLCPGFAGIDAETLMAVCLDVYTSEEIQKLSDRVRLIGEEGQSNILSMTLSGYQVPSGAYFINRTVPSLTVTPRGLKFNKVCHDRLQSCKYVDVLYHPVLQTLIVRASDEKSPNCVCWVNADGKPVQTLYQALRMMYGMFRVKGVSWWSEELPSKDEYAEAWRNLESMNFSVDFVISHCCPTSIQGLIDPHYKRDDLTDFLDEVRERTSFDQWLFGHYHDNKRFYTNYTLLYEQIVQVL